MNSYEKNNSPIIRDRKSFIAEIKPSYLRYIFLYVVFFCVSCSSVPREENQAGVYDPYESLNRKSYRFTDELDRRLIEPAANVYIEYVPEAIQHPVSNFYRNLSYPSVVLNSFLQGKIRQGVSDTMRFVINSTIGVGGLSDMAGHMGFEEHNEDFGQTLAVWGMGSGPYLFIPAYGPSNSRDMVDLPVSVFTDGLFYLAYALGGPVAIPLAILRIVDKRASLSGPMKIRDESALDPYLFVREGYMQQREYQIYDGNPPASHYDDLLIDDPDLMIESTKTNPPP
ncbi:phospholipid-binding lipoprotein MlaA [Nitrosomonas eutropha]|nr:phospholipid-binding lipoprotein MlaA [Nitrosomonas eutropha]